VPEGGEAVMEQSDGLSREHAMCARSKVRDPGTSLW
jgi:hypothetical protein